MKSNKKPWYYNFAATKAVVGRLCAQVSGEFSLLYRAPLCNKGCDVYTPVGWRCTLTDGGAVYTPLETTRQRMREEEEENNRTGDLPSVPKKY